MKATSKLFIGTLAVLLSIITVSSCESPKDPPRQVLEYQEANTLEEEFKRLRAQVINDTLGYEDTREFWFSLDSIKKYIEYVEYEARQKGYSDLGLRVYLAAYPENSSIGDPGYSTVFIVPTALQQSSSIHQGFWPSAAENQNLDSLKALNYGGGGQPPKDY